MDVIAQLKNGYFIYRESNEAGGHRYWTDSIGGGAVIWDTSIASVEELMVAIAYELTVPVVDPSAYQHRDGPRSQTQVTIQSTSTSPFSAQSPEELPDIDPASDE